MAIDYDSWAMKFSELVPVVLADDATEAQTTAREIEVTRIEDLISDAQVMSIIKDEDTILYLASHFVVLARAERDMKRKKDYGMGELEAEQFISKRTEFKTFASTNSEVFFTTTPYGRFYNDRVRIFGGVGIVQLVPKRPYLVRYTEYEKCYEY